MKPIIIVALMLTVGWAVFSLDSYSKTISNDIANTSSEFTLGYLIGMFITTFSPLGAVMAIHGYMKRKNNKKVDLTI